MGRAMIINITLSVIFSGWLVAGIIARREIIKNVKAEGEEVGGSALLVASITAPPIIFIVLAWRLAYLVFKSVTGFFGGGK